MIISTKDAVAGKRIVKELGLVSGSIVQSKNFVRDWFAGIRNFLGQEIVEYTDMLKKARIEATNRMTKEAESLGGNAILSTRFTTSTIVGGGAEILAYGSAVKLEVRK